MKIKSLLTAILLISFQNFFAQETPVKQDVDSVKQNQDSVYTGKPKTSEKEILEQQLKEDKKALKQQELSLIHI
jgi:hypothetical protein